MIAIPFLLRVTVDASYRRMAKIKYDNIIKIDI